MRINPNNWPTGSQDSVNSNNGDNLVRGRIIVNFTVPADEAEMAIHMIPNLLGDALVQATLHHCQNLEVTNIARLD